MVINNIEYNIEEFVPQVRLILYTQSIQGFKFLCIVHKHISLQSKNNVQCGIKIEKEAIHIIQLQ